MQQISKIIQRKINSISRIAIVRTDKLGDMVLTLPMLNAINEWCPKAKIDVLANSYTEVLLKNQQLIHNYFLVDKIDGGIDSIFKDNQYDIVFFPRPRLNEIFSAFKHRIPIRVGSGYRWYSFLLNFKVFEHRKTAEKNEAEFNVGLVNSISGANHKASLVKPFIPSDIQIAEDILEHSQGKEIVIIHPGGGGSAPKWSAGNFGKLASMIIDNLNCEVIFTGSEEEKILSAEAMQYTEGRARNLCGQLSIEELMAVIAKSKCLIANSTGVLHIAAAIGVRVMGFYPNKPSMSSRRWGALTVNSVFLSPESGNDSNGNEDDLDRISVETAFAKLVPFFKDYL